MIGTRALGLLVCVATLLVSPLSGPASARSSITDSWGLGPQHHIHIKGKSVLAVDEARGHVYLGADTRLEVLDLDGTSLEVLNGLQSGDGGMAIDSDGTIYRPGGTKVDVIDGTALTHSTVSVGAGCLHEPVLVSGLLFLLDCDGDLLALDPTTAQVTTGLTSLENTQLAASPARPGLLYALGATSVTEFQVSSAGTPAVSVVATAPVKVPSGGFAIGPGGQQLILGQGFNGKYAATAMDPVTLHATALTGVSRADMIGIRQDGLLAIDLDPQHLSARGLTLLAPGESTPFRRYGMHSEIGVFAVAFGTTRMYTVASDEGVDRTDLYVTTPRRSQTVDLTQERGTYRYGDKAQLTVRLSSTSTDRGARLYLIPEESHSQTGRLLRSFTVPASGLKKLSVPMHVSGELVVRVPGSSGYDGAEDSVYVQVKPFFVQTLIGSHPRHGRYAVFGIHQTARVRAQIKPMQPGCIQFEAYYFNVRDNGWELLGSTDCLTPRQGVASGSLVGSKALDGVKIQVQAEFLHKGKYLVAEGKPTYLIFRK